MKDGCKNDQPTSSKNLPSYFNLSATFRTLLTTVLKGQTSASYLEYFHSLNNENKQIVWLYLWSFKPLALYDAESGDPLMSTCAFMGRSGGGGIEVNVLTF